MSVVGGAIRNRFGRGSKEKESSASGSKDDKDGGTKKEKKTKKKAAKGGKKDGGSGGSEGRGGGRSAHGSGKAAPASGAPAASAEVAAHAAASSRVVEQLCNELLAALQGHDARCNLQVFAQQVQLLNQRLGKPSDHGQIQALFGASQVNGYIDFGDFLRRESTRRYLEMDSAAFLSV